MKQIYPMYPNHIRDDEISYDDVTGYIITTPHFEDYKYGKYYYVISKAHGKIVNTLSIHYTVLKEFIS